jgi:hypothetical protein
MKTVEMKCGEPRRGIQQRLSQKGDEMDKREEKNERAGVPRYKRSFSQAHAGPAEAAVASHGVGGVGGGSATQGEGIREKGEGRRENSISVGDLEYMELS